jgi:cytochrome c peroxidase
MSLRRRTAASDRRSSGVVPARDLARIARIAAMALTSFGLCACGDASPSEKAVDASTGEVGPATDASAPRVEPAALAAELGLDDGEVRSILGLGGDLGGDLGGGPGAELGDGPGVLETLVPEPTNRVATDDAAATFGQRLFFDPRLSGDGSVSCATCHDPELAFTDGLAIAEGLGPGTRNTPTILDAAHQRWFTWDGRADSLWSQALQPMERPHEMGSTRTGIVRTVLGDPALRREYEAIFGEAPETAWVEGLPERARPVPDAPRDPASLAWADLPERDRDLVNEAFANIGKALAAYQRRLSGGEVPLDRFVRGLREGDRELAAALDPQELAGLKLFVGKANCIDCHDGRLLSDGEFHAIGAPVPGGGMPTDAGRYLGVDIVKADEFNAASRWSDAPESARALQTARLARSPETWGRFRTPSLRQVAATPPYMHAGQMPDLRSVVDFYSTLDGATILDHHQETVLMPLGLDEGEIEALVAFLETMRGPGPDPSLLGPPGADRSN